MNLPCVLMCVLICVLICVQHMNVLNLPCVLMCVLICVFRCVLICVLICVLVCISVILKFLVSSDPHHVRFWPGGTLGFQLSGIVCLFDYHSMPSGDTGAPAVRYCSSNSACARGFLLPL